MAQRVRRARKYSDRQMQIARAMAQAMEDAPLVQERAEEDLAKAQLGMLGRPDEPKAASPGGTQEVGVRAHTRVSRTGKVVQVKAHRERRKKGQEPLPGQQTLTHEAMHEWRKEREHLWTPQKKRMVEAMARDPRPGDHIEIRAQLPDGQYVVDTVAVEKRESKVGADMLHLVRRRGLSRAQSGMEPRYNVAEWLTPEVTASTLRHTMNYRGDEVIVRRGR